MTRNTLVALLCSAVLIGCSQDEPETQADPAAGAALPVAAQQDSLTALDSTAHMGHTTTAEPAAAGEHEEHTAPLSGARPEDHAGHTPSRATTGSGGPAHPAGHKPAPAATGNHAAHDAPAATAANHAAAAHPSHPAPATGDTVTHAGHAAPASAAADPHAAHAAAPAAQPAADPHAAHAAAPAAQPAADSHTGHTVAPAAAQAVVAMDHAMTMVSLGGGWMAIGMAQAIPTATVSLPAEDGTPLERRGLYLTQPALMLNVESRESRVALRTTLNFEGLTQPGGELTFGGWGEGFLDKRHPHTYLHEAMLSVNVWARNGGGFSVSAGKGFAPYGTDDPMSRPVIKYPTNHHLSQILERFTLNAVYVNPSWSVEAGVFGGNEPSAPGDFSNVESFANSWSARVTRHFGLGAMGTWPFELGASYGYIEEEHGEHETTVTRLMNVSLRHENDHDFGRLYSLVEWSKSDPDEGDGYFSLLGETSIASGAHKPYARVEYATRPEYPREGSPESRAFFRYDHDEHAIGSTRWLTVVGGYGVTATPLPFSARPYAELQWSRVSGDRGGIEPETLFGRDSFFTLSAGLRVFLGGEPMRMGAYGALDAMTLMHRMQMVGPAAGHRH